MIGLANWYIVNDVSVKLSDFRVKQSKGGLGDGGGADLVAFNSA